MQLPTPGDWFQRRYELHELLGKGGFAAVYRAIDHDVGREVAIKILMPDHSGYEPGLVQRFMREGRIVAGLQDPHTITMYDFGRTENDLLFMVFEYVHGSDLSKLLMRTGPMPEVTVIHILQQLCSALREAHSAGILHRDIKPANVLVHTYMEDNRRVKLLDFGIAKPTMQEGEVDEIEENKSGMSPGTPRYMSPEQIYGDELTAASDIFSLGLVAYELLTGNPAIKGRTAKETLLQQLSDKPIRLPPYLRVGPELRQLVDWMTEKRAADRPQSIQQVMQHLAVVHGATASRPLTGRPGVPPSPVASGTFSAPTAPPEPQEPWLTPERREMLQWVGLVAGGLVVIAALLVGLAKLVGRIVDRMEPAPPAQVAPPPVVTAVATPEPAPPKPVPVVADAPDLGQAESDAGPPPLGPSGCGSTAEFMPGFATTMVRAADGPVEYTYYLPRDYDATIQYPVVILFHDDRGAMTGVTDMGLGRLADKQGLIVIAPQGPLDRPWRVSQGRRAAKIALEDAHGTLCLDRSRIFVAGHGFAGRMAEELACHMPVSAIATTSYLPPPGPKGCMPKPPVPTIRLMGMDNVVLSPKGKSTCDIAVSTIPLDYAETRAYERNECTGKDRAWGKHSFGTCTTRDCGDAPFVQCRLDGAYEFDNITIPLPITGKLCRSERTRFDVTQTIWRFFDKEGRRLDQGAPTDE